MRDEHGFPFPEEGDLRYTQYEFIDEQGTVEVFEFPMMEVPSIGESIQREGKRWTRTFSSNMQAYVEPDVHVQTHSLPKQRPVGHPDYANYNYPQTDARGRPQWKSLKEIRNWGSRNGEYTWDRSTMIGQKGVPVKARGTQGGKQIG